MSGVHLNYVLACREMPQPCRRSKGNNKHGWTATWQRLSHTASQHSANFCKLSANRPSPRFHVAACRQTEAARRTAEAKAALSMQEPGRGSLQQHAATVSANPDISVADGAARGLSSRGLAFSTPAAFGMLVAAAEGLTGEAF